MSNIQPVLYLKDLSISLGKEQLFAEVNLQLYKGDRICLVGKNGSGKSTMLKIIAGTIEHTDGMIFVHPGLSIGYLPQATSFVDEQTIYEYVLEVFIKKEDWERHKYLADIFLNQLKVPSNGLMKHLSGGMQRRVTLTRALIQNPDIILLDEPTNHLDIESIIWLEQYLNEYKGSVICISHDRRFLDNISNKSWWLYKRRLFVHNKGFKFFNIWAEDIAQQQTAILQKLYQQLDTENTWLAYGVTARRKRNQGRLEKLLQLRTKLKSEIAEFAHQNKNLRIDTFDKKATAKSVIELNHVCLSFANNNEPKKILHNFSMRIIKGERIGIIGANGSGKSSFLKLIIGSLKPDSGKVKLGTNLSISYFDQNREQQDPDKTLWETLCPNGGNQLKVGARFVHVLTHLKNFMFDSKQATSPVSSLSGGEASRLLLAKILADPGNFLIFDEPTNDLDMDTLDILEEVLSHSKSTMLIVSHDREFLNRITTRCLVFKGKGEIIDYFGGYDNYNECNKVSIATKKIVSISKNEQTPKERTTSKLTYNLQREFDLLPEKIDNFTAEITKLQEILADTELFEQNPKKFNKAIKDFDYKKLELEQAELRWLELAEIVENLRNNCHT